MARVDWVTDILDIRVAIYVACEELYACRYVSGAVYIEVSGNKRRFSVCENLRILHEKTILESVHGPKKVISNIMCWHEFPTY